MVPASPYSGRFLSCPTLLFSVSYVVPCFCTNTSGACPTIVCFNKIYTERQAAFLTHVHSEVADHFGWAFLACHFVFLIPTGPLLQHHTKLQNGSCLDYCVQFVFTFVFSFTRKFRVANAMSLRFGVPERSLHSFPFGY